MITSLRRLTAAACAALTIASFPASVVAQDESALKSYFEGRRITLRLDMPGSADGVDVLIEPARGINYKEYRDDLKKFGTSLAAGDSSTITQIKVKKDLIEFHIGGGGYGTFGDDTSTSSGIKLLDKTEREKTLDERIKEETDRRKRRDMQDELDYLRTRRERENRSLRAESDRIEEMKRERLAERRLRGGSRFNIKENTLPANISPEDVIAALTEYVDFSGGSRQTTFAPPPPADLTSVRKGMLRDEAERAFGAPTEKSDNREGGVVVTTLVFDVGDQRLTANFVEDVLVRYTISSR